MGLTFEQFWSMTFTEVDVVCKGYETRMSRVKEVPRLIACMFANVNRGKGQAYMPPERIFPLYTDSLKRVDTIKSDEYENILQVHGRSKPTEEEKERLINRMKWRNRDLKRN